MAHEMTKRVFAVLRDCTMIEVLMIRACNHRLLILTHTERERERETFFFYLERGESLEVSSIWARNITILFGG